MKTPHAPITPTHKLTLPEGLDSIVAATLAAALADCRGADVTIDAAHVRWLGVDAVDVLRSAESTWRQDGRRLTLANGQASLIDDLKYFGVEPHCI